MSSLVERIWAYDASGKLVGAKVRVSGGDSYPADGTDIPVEGGEHAVLVTADGFVAGSTTLNLEAGEQREISVILAPGPTTPAPPPPSPAPPPSN